MKIVLIGGGSGGHITPLLAVAREIKQQHPDAYLTAVCEQGSAFVQLYHDEMAIDEVHQIVAGKYRRYGGQSFWRRVTDIGTIALNIRDIFRTLRGYRQARKLLKRLQPDALLIKGGFVAVPMGLAASRLKIPYMTHDSDSTPGLANRIIGKWADLHATGMPAELYTYPAERTVYTGIPVSDDFVEVTDKVRQAYRKELGLEGCRQVITIAGGSQGGEQLNKDMVTVVQRLAQTYEGLGVVHIAGDKHAEATLAAYTSALTPEQATQVRVSGFVTDVAVRQGAADVVVSRAGATVTAELALQRLPVVFVPGRLAGSHQHKNAQFFVGEQAALMAPFGDTDQLFAQVEAVLSQPEKARVLAENLHAYAKPQAAQELATLITNLAVRAAA